MKYLKSMIGATTILGALGLSMPATANVYEANFPILEVHGQNGAYTSSSLAGASLMGERGMSGTYEGFFIPNKSADPQHSGITSFASSQFAWETSITTACATQTLTLFPTTQWPSRCNPIGMANHLNDVDPQASWSVFQENVPFPLVGQTDLLNVLATNLFLFGGPGMTPIFGQADHWVTVFQLTATPVTGSPGQYTVTQALAFDGGGLGSDPLNPLTDSSGAKYRSGLQTFTGSAFKNIVFPVVTGINPSCDSSVIPGGQTEDSAPLTRAQVASRLGISISPTSGCTSDPFFHNFVLIFDPPPGQPEPNVHADFVKAPGIEPHGAMNAEKAQHRVWDALIAAGINKDPASWDPLSGSVPGQAVLVTGVYPDGSAWDYYLVPLLVNASSVAAFVQLSADDGSFEHISVFSSPLPYAAPVTKAHAKQLASGVLAKGDRLTTDGVLTFNPLSDSALARTPNAPYYEFGVIDANGKSTTARVTFHDGVAIRGRIHDGKIVHGQ